MRNSVTQLRRRPLRRFREVVCLVAAVVLYLAIWGLARGGYESHQGHLVLSALGLGEAASLCAVFLLEWRRPRRRPAMPWITMAWLSLPAWCLLEVLAALTLRATTV